MAVAMLFWGSIATTSVVMILATVFTMAHLDLRSGQPRLPAWRQLCVHLSPSLPRKSQLDYALDHIFPPNFGQFQYFTVLAHAKAQRRKEGQKPLAFLAAWCEMRDLLKLG
jgi:hypothetical protein